MQNRKNEKINIKQGFFLLCAVLIFAVLPLLIFRPIKQNISAQEPQKRFTFMTEFPQTDQQEDPYGLHYWEIVGNPKLFAKPDRTFGFSAFLSPQLKHKRPAGFKGNILPVIPEEYPLKQPGIKKERSPEQFLPFVQIPLIKIPDATAPEFQKAPVCTLENGTKILLHGVKLNISAGKKLKPSVFMISGKQDNHPPEIRLLSSSGDYRFDQEAMRVLYFPAAENPYISGVVRVEWEQNEVIK